MSGLRVMTCAGCGVWIIERTACCAECTAAALTVAQARSLRAEAERDTLAGQMGYVAEGIVTALLYLNDGDPSPQVAEWSDATRTLVRELSRIHRAGIDLPSAPSAWLATLRADDEARGTCSPCHGTGVIDCSPGPVSDCDYCGGTGRA